jgi:hypothetical protein
VELALPDATTAEARLAIVQAFSMELANRYGVAVSAAIDHPDKESDQRNHHAHIMFTTREMGENGLGAKTRVLDDRTTGPQEGTHLRAYAADLINEALADSGRDERVDHRSFKERGIDAEPTTHEGPTATNKERRGEPSDRGDENREIAENNAQREKINDLVEELAELHSQIAQQAAHEFETDLLLRKQASAAPAEDDQAEGVAWSFEALHGEKVRQARAEMETMAAERGNRWNEAIAQRVERVGVWWQNMRESFTEWRSGLQENVTSWWERTRGDQKPPEPEPPATAPVAASPPPPEPMEPGA